jgi:hypothetical protein
MSQDSFGSDAERHRQQAAATERHAAHSHSNKSASHASVDSQEQAESTFFVRHRNKLGAAFLAILAVIFFTVVIFGLRL